MVRTFSVNQEGVQRRFMGVDGLCWIQKWPGFGKGASIIKTDFRPSVDITQSKIIFRSIPSVEKASNLEMDILLV